MTDASVLTARIRTAPRAGCCGDVWSDELRFALANLAREFAERLGRALSADGEPAELTQGVLGRALERVLPL